MNNLNTLEKGSTSRGRAARAFHSLVKVAMSNENGLVARLNDQTLEVEIARCVRVGDRACRARRGIRCHHVDSVIDGVQVRMLLRRRRLWPVLALELAVQEAVARAVKVPRHGRRRLSLSGAHGARSWWHQVADGREYELLLMGVVRPIERVERLAGRLLRSNEMRAVSVVHGHVVNVEVELT